MSLKEVIRKFEVLKALLKEHQRRRKKRGDKKGDRRKRLVFVSKTSKENNRDF